MRSGAHGPTRVIRRPSRPDRSALSTGRAMTVSPSQFGSLTTRCWTSVTPLIGSPRTAGPFGFRSPRPLGPQPQGGLRLALRPRDVLRLALPRSPVALLDGGAAAEVVEAG